jgi:iron complex outermembrane receptor protein
MSRSFEPPTWGELSGGNNPGFKDLSAQYATTAEMGMRGLSNKIHWQAAYYHGWLRDEFVNFQFADGSTATINVPKSKRDGVELGLNGDIKQNIWQADDAINIRAAYTLSYFTLDHNELYGNNQVSGVPMHYFRGEILYRYPSGISLGPNIEWSPKASPVDLTNTLYAGSYTIYGARAFWESKNGKWNSYIEGRNLLNKKYTATYNVIPNAGGQDGRYFYPGEGQAVYVGIGLKL